ncbi:MAG: MarR family winged helix-turn-helix transcriptional regulator [Actinomycetota bacterium]
MSERPDFRDTQTLRLLRALVEARERFRKMDDAQIHTYGLTSSEFDCLVTLGVDQPLRMCDMAERSLLTKSHATQIVKQLEGKRLVHRERSRESEREVLVSLTPEGQELFERIYPQHFRFLKEWFGSRLNKQERAELTRLLRKMADGA